MFEAYKVGVTVALTNKVSQGLMLIGRDLAKTDAQALKLKTTLNEIKLLGIGGAILGTAGYAGLHALGKTLDAAKEYQQAFARFKSINLGEAVNKDADKFARGAQVIGASATDLMTSLRDLTAVFGDKNIDITRQIAPGLAQLKFANQAVYGGHGMDFGESQLRDLERIIEMKGGFKSPKDFLAQASMMQQVIASTGGMVKPSDYMNFIKTAGVSGRLLTDRSFYYGMEPLIQEMGGSRVGTGLMSAYNNLAQGRSTVRASTELMRLGLLDPKMVEYTKIGTIKQVRPGALKDNEGYGSNPFEWMQNVLLPAMRSKGITTEQGILQEMGVIFGNRTASSLFSLMFLQQEKIIKNMRLSEGAMNTDQMVKLARSSPQGAEMALGKAWENLKIAAGQSLIPIVIPALNKLAEALRSLGQWINRHPVKFDYLIKGFAGLSAAMAISGTLLAVTAGFKAIGLAIGITGGTTGLIASIAGMTAVLGPLAAVAATIAALANHEGIAQWIDKRAPQVGDWLMGEGQARTGAYGMAKNGIIPPPSGKNTTVNTTVNLDGRQIASVVSNHQANAASKPNASGSGFDGRMTPVYSGTTGSW